MLLKGEAVTRFPFRSALPSRAMPPMSQKRSRRHTGKLGETFRGNRGFLLTQQAPAHGRAQIIPEGFANTGFRRTADNERKPTVQQVRGNRSSSRQNHI